MLENILKNIFGKSWYSTLLFFCLLCLLYLHGSQIRGQNDVQAMKWQKKNEFQSIRQIMPVFVRAKEQRTKNQKLVSLCSIYWLKALSVEQTAQITSVQSWLVNGLLTEVINKIERLFSDQKHETIVYFKILINYPYKKYHIRYINK